MAKEKTTELLSQRKSLKDLKSYDFKVSTGSLIFDLFLDGGFAIGLLLGCIIDEARILLLSRR